MVDVEGSRNMRDIVGKKQVDFVIGWLKDVEGRNGHR